MKPSALVAFTVLMLVTGSAVAAETAWREWGPPNGEVRWLVADPHRSGVLYAGTERSGAFRSSDGGRSWSGASEGLGGAVLGAFAAAPDGTLWAAGEEAIFRSDDGATTWRTVHDGRLTPPPPFGATLLPHALAIAPDGSALYLAIGHELFRSRDGGATWDQKLVSSPPLGPLALDPLDSETVYLAARGGSGGLLVSHDGGDHWDAVLGAEGAGFPGGVVALAVSPEPATRIVVATGQIGLQESLDGGATWRRVVLPGFGGAEPREAISALDFDPHVPSRLFVGWGGLSLVQQGPGFPILDRSPGLPLEQPGRLTAHRLDADGLRVYTARGSDIASRRLGAVIAWEVHRFGGRTGTVAFHPRDPRKALVAAGAGFFQTTSGGDLWTWRPVPAELGSLRDVRFDRFAANGLLAAGTQGGFASPDGGLTWRRVAPRKLFSALVQSDSRTLFGLGCGLDRSADGGRRWRTVIPCGLSGLPPFVVGLQVSVGLETDPAVPSRMWLNLEIEGDPLVQGSHVLRSFDGGGTWQTWLRGTALAVAPGDRNVFYWPDGSTGMLRRSNHQGRGALTLAITAPAIRGGRGVAVDFATAERVATIQADGVAVSSDGGRHWRFTRAGIPGAFGRQALEADPHRPGRFVLETTGPILLADFAE